MAMRRRATAARGCRKNCRCLRRCPSSAQYSAQASRRQKCPSAGNRAAALHASAGELKLAHRATYGERGDLRLHVGIRDEMVQLLLRIPDERLDARADHTASESGVGMHIDELPRRQPVIVVGRSGMTIAAAPRKSASAQCFGARTVFSSTSRWRRARILSAVSATICSMSRRR